MSEISKYSHWGWKDPRTILLLPFWKTIVDDIKFVICIRNPVDVAKSLHLRDGIPISEGIELWTNYVEASVQDTDQHARIIVFYEDFFNETHKEITRLISFSGLSPAFNHMLAENAIFKSLNHSPDRGDFTEDLDSIRNAEALYESLYLSDHLERKKSEIISSKLPAENDHLGHSRLPARVIPKHKMVFPRFEEPLVSIVIPTFNKVSYLSACLRSIYQFTDVPYDLIIVDDGSTDETELLLDKLENVHIIKNKSNQDFLRSTNKGAKHARGKYIQFLNNDVMVRQNWLSLLVNTIEQYPKCGAVGGKLILMNGKLQEAGGIINKDGTSELYGANDDPFKPEYSYLREVDYCSAACLLVRKDLFSRLGSFDLQYAPAYFEDADLCFGIWHLGHKVVYQPEVASFHHMMGSRNPDLANRLYSENLPKFAEKWSAVLTMREQSPSTLVTRDRRQSKNLLILTGKTPIKKLDSIEGLQPYNLISHHLKQGYIVTLMPIDERYRYNSVYSQLQQKGVEVLYGSSFEPDKMLSSRFGHYQKVILSQVDEHQVYLDLAQSCFPDASITIEN